MKIYDELLVFVELNGAPVLAGRLRASLAGMRMLGGSMFTYDSNYFLTDGAYELDPALTHSRAPIYSGEDQSLFGAFQDLTPDDWGRKVIDANLAVARAGDPSIPRRINDFDYLALTSDATRLGAIRLQSPDNGEWVGDGTPPDLREFGLDAFADAAARFEAQQATVEDLELLGAPGSTAGGARPKVNVMMDGQLRMLKLPSDRDRHRDGEAWESVAITLARNAGINVQRGDLLRTSDGKSTLALHRFDRGPNGERIGYMSARTAMELGDQGHDQVTYEDFADTTDQITGGDRAQLRDLFKRVALNVLVSNDDDHWKNHGFLRGADTWKLSPAFDINPSVGGSAIYSRAISPKDDPRSRDIRNLVDTAKTYALSRRDTSEALAEVLSAVQEWPEVALRAGISREEIGEYEVAFRVDQQEHAEQAIVNLVNGETTIDLAHTARPAQPRRGDIGLGKSAGGGNSGSFAERRRTEADGRGLG